MAAEGLDTTTSRAQGDWHIPQLVPRGLLRTNNIESMISVCRENAGDVKRWRDGQIALRWCAAGMAEAGKQFRCVNGHLQPTHGPRRPRARVHPTCQIRRAQ